MKTLHLNLKRKWFDMILSGEKKEEYRDIKPYWTKRFNNFCFETITFSNGYSKNRDQFEIEVFGLSIKTGLKKWGAEKDKLYFVLILGNIKVPEEEHND